jgi:hypothetical protein
MRVLGCLDRAAEYGRAMSPLRLFESDMGQWVLSLEAGATPVDDVIAELGHEPNGYFWEGIVEILVQSEAKDLDGRFDSDPEAGAYVALSADRAVLERLGSLLGRLANDAALLRALVAKAEADGFQFDD